MCGFPWFWRYSETLCKTVSLPFLDCYIIEVLICVVASAFTLLPSLSICASRVNFPRFSGPLSWLVHYYYEACARISDCFAGQDYCNMSWDVSDGYCSLQSSKNLERDGWFQGFRVSKSGNTGSSTLFLRVRDNAFHLLGQWQTCAAAWFPPALSRL